MNNSTIKNIVMKEDSLEVALKQPVGLDNFSQYIERIVQENDKFVVAERERMYEQDTFESMLWGRRIRTCVDYVQSRVDYDTETATMSIRFNSSDCNYRTPAFEQFGVDGGRPQVELYTITGPRLERTDNYSVKRIKATKEEMNELYEALKEEG